MAIKIRRKDLVKGKELNKIGKSGLKSRKRRILCIILHEGKGSTWYWLNETQELFSINENTYFKVDAGTYLKDVVRFMIFLEGVSVPIHHGYIEREEITKEIEDKDTGKNKKYRFWKIKGLNFDSKVIDILLNRHLADEFTKQHMDVPNLVIIILLCVTLIIGFVNIGLHFA